jgi:hypothetical protein
MPSSTRKKAKQKVIKPVTTGTPDGCNRFNPNHKIQHNVPQEVDKDKKVKESEVFEGLKKSAGRGGRGGRGGKTK